jgi:hypothetical protein
MNRVENRPIVQLQNIESLDIYINYWVRFIYYSLQVRAVQRKVEARGERPGSRDEDKSRDKDRRSKGSKGVDSNISEESRSKGFRSEVSIEARPKQVDKRGSGIAGSQEAGEEEEEVKAEGGQGKEVEEEDKDIR